MNLKKIKLIAALILLGFSSNSCMLIGSNIAKGKATKLLTVENGAIPPDFAKNKATLLVVKWNRKSYDKFLVKNFQEYQGDYEIVSLNDINTEAYANKEKYRYVFDHFPEPKNYRNQSQGTETSNEVKRFSITDRIGNRQYESKFVSMYFSKVMKAYIENLNLELEKNR